MDHIVRFVAATKEEPKTTQFVEGRLYRYGNGTVCRCVQGGSNDTAHLRSLEAWVHYDTYIPSKWTPLPPRHAHNHDTRGRIMKAKQVVHKVVPGSGRTWVVAQCGAFVYHRTSPGLLQASSQWPHVTCKNCLRCMPKKRRLS